MALRSRYSATRSGMWFSKKSLLLHAFQRRLHPKLYQRTQCFRYSSEARPAPIIFPTDVPVNEERLLDYDPLKACPVRPHDLLNSRYRVIAKVGYGNTSTTWLAEDTSTNPQQKFVVVKVHFSTDKAVQAAGNEEHVCEILRSHAGHTEHPGAKYVRKILTSFEHRSPYGAHPCLVFELVREPIWFFQERLPGNVLGSTLLRGWVKLLLLTLNYLHEECGVVHSDLCAENIMISCESKSNIESYMAFWGPKDRPFGYKPNAKTGEPVYMANMDFGPFHSLDVKPSVIDFGEAKVLDATSHFLPIQPDSLKAPEVILGTGWSYSADVWNLAALVWEFLESRDLLQHREPDTSVWTPAAHLAELIALLGPPPKHMTDRSRKLGDRDWGWVLNSESGKPCRTVNEYFGGPFFDSKGEFICKSLIPQYGPLQDKITNKYMGDEEKDAFVDFFDNALAWDPTRRPSAVQLAFHPWLVENWPEMA